MNDSNDAPPRFILRPRDQTSITLLLAVALSLMGATWWRHARRQGWVDIDRAPPLTARFQVDVNRAKWPELLQLPGVGQVLAERLVADRERNGVFRSVEDLKRVRGLGPRTLERIRPYVLPIADDANIAGKDLSQRPTAL